MAQHRFQNLRIIDNTELRDIDATMSGNTVFATVPDTISDTFNHYDLAEAIQQQFQINIEVEDISRYNEGYFLRVHTQQARTNMLHRGFIIVRNYLIGLRPWNPEHGSIAVSLQTVLTSCPLNIHLATDIPLSDPYEHLTIHITGVPPHLCCNSLIHKLFHKICIIHSVNFISATTEYEISARGRVTMIPQTAHLGIRNLSGQSEVINIWQLSYQTFTDEMLGRQTPPGDRRSDLRGYSDIDTEQRLELVDSNGNNEATSRLQVASDTSTMDTSDNSIEE